MFVIHFYFSIMAIIRALHPGLSLLDSTCITTVLKVDMWVDDDDIQFMKKEQTKRVK